MSSIILFEVKSFDGLAKMKTLNSYFPEKIEKIEKIEILELLELLKIRKY
jgi:hypothetical protein